MRPDGDSLAGMRGWKLKSCTLLGALLIAPAAFAQDAPGGQSIHRCVGAHGEIVFSGVACAAGASANASPSPDSVTPALSNERCPASREALQERISGAIARHDPNALASLLRWRGVGTRAASERMRSLRDLVRRPLLGMDGGGAGDAASETPSSASADILRVRTGSNESDGVRENRFDVVVEGACYWLVW